MDASGPDRPRALHVEAITVGPIATNAYLVGDPATLDAVLVDPGGEPERLLARSRQGGWRVREIWITHAHFDHVAALDAIVAGLGEVPVRMHPDDRELYATSAELALRLGGLVVEQPTAPTRDLAHGDALQAGSLRATVRHVPGHAPGHVVFVLDGAGAVLAGDTLFQGGIGRTDIPFGDHDVLLAGIRRELFSLPPETVVWPGHGPATTVGREAKTNPFFAR